MVKPNSSSPGSESAEVAESYNQWLRAKIERAIADTRPAIPHDQVVARVRARIDAARIRRNAAED
ncbi:antitoxin [Stenotrophomonas maltophilia]|uniref:type II toxin-antitoxin system RelB family antitoxin n=1 Tax=Stenotrophomonas TaxID=40323 RepID=UPI0009FC83ED